MPIVIIKQGESFDYLFDLDGESTAGWVCTINLKQYPDDETLIKRVIPAVEDTWPGTLSKNDTKNLNVGQYLLIANLVNETTNEKEQDIRRFQVSKTW